MHPIFIISAEKGSGKTTFLINILTLLQMNGFSIEGFVSLHEPESDCYKIKDIKTNEEVSLMQRVASFEQRPNHFKFSPEGIELGDNCFKELFARPPNIAVVDEIGGYELAGKLWSTNFKRLVNSSIPLLFTTKAKHLDKVLRKWSMKPVLIFYAADFDNPQKAVEMMQRFL